MTSEDLFTKWFNSNTEIHHEDDVVYWASEGFKAGMEEAAKICDARAEDAKLSSFAEPSGKGVAMTEFYEAEECAFAIREAKDKL